MDVRTNRGPNVFGRVPNSSETNVSTDESVREVEPAEERATAASDPDGFFGFLAGLYAAALVAPAVAIGVALEATADAGVLFAVLLGTTVAVVAGVGWVARRRSVAVRLGGTRWIWLAVALPFGYAALLLGAVEDGAASGAVVGLSMVAVVVGLFVGLGLVAAAHNRYAKTMLAEAEEFARFTAPAPERDRRLVKWAVIGLFVAGIASLAVSLIFDSALLRTAFQLLIPIGAALYGTTTDRNVVVTDAGLVVGNPVHKRLQPWSNFESYAVTDESIVVRRSGWSPWGLRDVRRSLQDVDDPDAVATALDRVLPRR